ncbi:MAG: hypothetical protein WC140_01130 [Bacteroidales bacterium]
MGILGVILSAVALIFSVFTYFKHDKKIKQQSLLLNKYHLEKIEKEKEEDKKATIEASVMSRHNGPIIVKVSNLGKSIARNVNVIIPKNDRYRVITNPCPIEIRPLNSIEIIIGDLLINYPQKIDIRFEWSDDFNKKNSDTQMIQI